jgi:vacuolar protein sorting-associated protein IST1
LWKVFGFSGSGGSDSTSAAVPATKSQGVKDENQDPSHENALEEEEPEQDEVYIERELDKSAAVIFYAYPRIPRDIPGLPELRAKLALRWGSDFANRSQEDNPPVKIPKELADRLRVHRPSEELIEMYLREIARSHGIPWHQDEDENEEEGDDGGQVPDTEGNLPKASSGDAAALGDKGEAKGSSKAGSVSKDLGGEKASQPGAGKAKDRSGGIPDVDELTRRFAALKK